MQKKMNNGLRHEKTAVWIRSLVSLTRYKLKLGYIINLQLILELWLLHATLGTETFAQAKQATLGKNFGPKCMIII